MKTATFAFRLASLALGLWFCATLGCSDPAPSACPANVERPCTCTNGRVGTQVCNATRTALLACRCDGGLDASVPSDGSPAVLGEIADTHCAEGLTHCGRCVNLQSDPAHCGACGRACGAGQWCSDGSCGGGCTEARVFCADRCVDTTSDQAHCGACGRACAAGETCLTGRCTPSCEAPQTSCGGACVLTASDPAHCGSCGRACPSGSMCFRRNCLSAALPFNVSVTHPVVRPPALGSRSFPLYLSHLIGSATVRHPIEMEVACFTLASLDGAPHTARITVDVPGYTDAAAVRSVAVPATGTTRACVSPTFSAARVRALTEATRGQVTYSVEMVGAGFTLSDYLAVDLLPAGDIVWEPPSDHVSQPAMDALSAVFVRPDDPSVVSLQAAVEARSAWPGALHGYERPRRPRSHAIAPGSYAYENVYLEPGETLALEVGAIDGARSVDVALFRASAYAAWQSDRSGVAAQAWPASEQGATQSFTSTSGGWYVLVLNAPGSAAVRVAWTRSNSREDVAEYALRAVYDALRTRGITYTDISASFYAGAQHLRTPAEVLATRTGNCIEGAFLFASLLERLGLDPVLVYTNTHALVALRSRPASAGAAVLWPLETTLLESQPFEVAFNAGRQQLASIPLTAAYFNTVDVRAARQAGVAPTP